MSRILEFLAVIVRKIETLVLYFIERFSANFQAFDQGTKTFLVIVLIVIFIDILFFITLFLRLDFKRRLRKLRNVRTIMYVDQLREKGKRITFLHDIFYFQKVVIIDEEVVLRTPAHVDVKKPKKMKKRKSRKKDNLPNQSAPLLDPADDIYVLDFIKLNRRMVTSTFFILVTIVTLIFTRYKDFDVIFRALYMLKYENYNLIENMGSILFISAFAVSALMTIFIWIYFYTRGGWQDKLNMRWIYDTFDIVSIIPTFIAILTVLNSFLISPATVTHTSMEPNYFEGDNIFILHMANYERFDVVIVLANEGEYNPDTDAYTLNEYYIKRIIGLPGDTVRIEDGAVYINDVELDDSEYLKPNVSTYCGVGMQEDPDEVCVFTVPEGEYFLLGDNRSTSLDSRLIGTFKKEEFYGVVILKVG